MKLLKYLEENKAHYLILESKSFLQNPAQKFQSICENIGIPYEETMLKWKAGERPEDGCWAKYWYNNVHQSTGFKSYEEKEIVLPERLLPVFEESMKYYKILLNKAI